MSGVSGNGAMTIDEFKAIVGANGEGHALCRAHGDTRPSLHVFTSKRGALGWAFKCVSQGCSREKILAAFDLDWQKLYGTERAPDDPGSRRGKLGDPVATYVYTDAQGGPLYRVERYERDGKKTFVMARRDPTARVGWRAGARNTKRVLYRLAQLAAADAEKTVFWVEGEKCADRLAAHGLLATTTVQGATNFHVTAPDHIREALAGRHVAIIPDNDAAGRAYAGQVARCLASSAASVKVLDLPVSAEGADVVDWIADGGTAEELERLAAAPSAPASTPPAAPDEDDLPPLRSRSYLSCVTVIRRNLGDVLGGRTLEHDDLAGAITLGRRALTEEDVSAVRAEIERKLADGKKGLQFSIDDVHRALAQVAAERSFHPVCEYLAGLRWDGRERFAGLVRALGATDTPLHRTMLAKTLIGAVARAERAGCKLDTMLILVGEQGIFKSTFFDTLAVREEWFSSSPVAIGEKDGQLALRGKWIIELPELSALRRARDAEQVKHFLSERIDRYRPPYGRLEVRIPRSCVLVGSTNDPAILSDPTGSRRFWPLRVGRIDLEWVRRNRDQLWGEAREALARGAQWWLTAEEEDLLEEEREMFKKDDPWSEFILHYVNGRETVTTAEILGEVAKLPVGQWTDAHAKRVVAVLREAGWTEARRGPKRDRERCWKAPDGGRVVGSDDSADHRFSDGGGRVVGVVVTSAHDQKTEAEGDGGREGGGGAHVEMLGSADHPVHPATEVSSPTGPTVVGTVVGTRAPDHPAGAGAAEAWTPAAIADLDDPVKYPPPAKANGARPSLQERRGRGLP